jgi:hypothetical protein
MRRLLIGSFFVPFSAQCVALNQVFNFISILETAPRSLRQSRSARGQDGATLVITLSPPPMRNITHDDTHTTCCLDERAQMGKQIDGLGHWSDLGP